MIKPSRSLLLGGAVFVVAAAVLFTYTFLAAGRANDRPEPRPTLAAAAGGTLVDVKPLQYCKRVASLECDAPIPPVKLAVAPGEAIVISLPDYITARPWDVTVQRYDTRLGRATLETQTHVRPTAATLVLKSTDELLLAAVEIRVPSEVQDAFGNLISQAVWGIDTLPEGIAPVPRL